MPHEVQAAGHPNLFAFEADFVDTLRCVPMAVRMKLDRCAVKLTLRQWSRFTHADRRRLLEQPCDTSVEVADYSALLRSLIRLRTGEAARPLLEPPPTTWRDPGEVATAVIDFAQSCGVPPPDVAAWGRLSALQRFVLVKLSRDNHDNVNFVPALREFGLLRE